MAKEEEKVFCGALKTEVQVITSNSDEVYNAVPYIVSTSTNASIQTEKHALDVGFTESRKI